MQRTNDPAHHQENYINGTSDDHRHKTNIANPTGNSSKSPQKTHTNPDYRMSNNEDRTNNINAS
jgi:hypothetical protein